MIEYSSGIIIIDPDWSYDGMSTSIPGPGFDVRKRDKPNH